jgi:hypothetical protein
VEQESAMAVQMEEVSPAIIIKINEEEGPSISLVNY